MNYRKRLIYLFSSFLISFSSIAQPVYDSIDQKLIENTITYLASDYLKGRVNYTPEQLQAAEFLADFFGDCSLSPFPGAQDFYLPFRPFTKRSAKDKLEWNGVKMDESLFVYIPHKLYSGTQELEDFIILKAMYPIADSILFYQWQVENRNLILQVDLPEGVSFTDATRNIIIPSGHPSSDILIVAAHDAPEKVKITPDKKRLSSFLYNIVGVLPGRSRADEIIIFSAHYDHISMGMDGKSNGYYNGANDNASGTTAVLALARYFALRNDNERTIMFCLFAGEELGLLGSTEFVRYIDPETIKAVINIEMIGKTNRTGKNAFVVTGSDYSDLDEILGRNLAGQKVKLVKERSDPRNLFLRSDNYPFAKEGIPAHSIMCSDDDDPCYHDTCDDVKSINIENMTKVIRAIAHSTSTLISGKDTPLRITKKLF